MQISYAGSSKNSLELKLTDNDHLLVLFDKLVLESIFLPMCDGNGDQTNQQRPLQALRKLDKIVFVTNVSNLERRVFRLSVSVQGCYKNNFVSNNHMEFCFQKKIVVS